MRSARARVVVVAFGALLLTTLSCKQNKSCAPNTVFVSLSFSGQARDADGVSLLSCVGQACRAIGPLQRAPGATTDSVELTFATYNAGQPLTVTVTPTRGATALAPACISTTLLAGCTPLTIAVGDSGATQSCVDGGSGAGGMSNGGQSGSGGNLGLGGSNPSGGRGGAAGAGGHAGSSGTGTGGAGGASTGCTAPATRCSGTGVQTCVNGQWGSAVACGARQTCTGPVGTAQCACKTDPVCGVVGPNCAGGSTLATCMMDQQTCLYQSSSSPCNGGACGGPPGAAACCVNACSTGAALCLSGSSLQTCAVAASGCTAITSVTCASGLVCERSPSACVDPTWAEWSMPNDPVEVAAGAPNVTAYNDNGDGTVTDKVTGLMWQQAVRALTLTWTDALAYCPKLPLASYTDWRLPSRIELTSLVDLDATSTAIDVTYFPVDPAVPTTIFWTSSLLANSPAAAWTVNFGFGPTSYADITQMYAARCVR